MGRPPAPLALLKPQNGAAEALSAAREAEGWTRRSGWRLPEAAWDLAPLRIVCVGRLRTAADAKAALLAAARGAGVVAVVDPAADRHVVERFYEDLSRLGTVELEARDRGAFLLSSDQRRLLELLGEGKSIAEAARLLFVSRRTADRRLAAARSALGVATTAEAVVAVRRAKEPEATSSSAGF